MFTCTEQKEYDKNTNSVDNFSIYSLPLRQMNLLFDPPVQCKHDFLWNLSQWLHDANVLSGKKKKKKNQTKKRLEGNERTLPLAL
jgi:hypothetical protein